MNVKLEFNFYLPFIHLLSQKNSKVRNIDYTEEI